MSTTTGFPVLASPAPEGAVVALTPHPLQRAGGWALAFLAGADHPEALTVQDFEKARSELVEIVCAVSDVTDATATKRNRDGTVTYAAQPHAWLWRIYNGHFPNSKATHWTARKKPAEQRHQAITDQILLADEQPPPAGIACAFCGRPAAATVGKDGLPLGVAEKYAGWGPRDVHGTPICAVCAACVWAAPLAATHRWERSLLLEARDDDALTRELMRQAFDLTMPFFGAGLGEAPWEEHRTGHPAAVQLLLGRPALPRDAVTLLNYKPGNQNAEAAYEHLDHSVATWLTRLTDGTDRRRGYQLICRAYTKTNAQGVVTTDGFTAVARRLFDAQDRPAWSLSRLALQPARRLWPDGGGPEENCCVQAPQLLAGCADYAREVTAMNQADVERIEALAERIAEHVTRRDRRGEMQDLRRALTGQAQGGFGRWLSHQQWEYTLGRDAPGPEPLYDTADHRLVFDSDGYEARNLLEVAIVERLHRRLHGNSGRPETAPKDTAEGSAGPGEELV